MTTKAKIKKVKTKDKILQVVDLFCGAGGTSTGVVNAVQSLGFDINLLAINHWDVAIATHTHNHPSARHECQSIDSLNPQDLVPGKRLNLLLASPECTDHSNAKGGKPRSDQKRADAWLLMRWIEKLYVENIIIENVKEFINWGPLNAKGLPDKRHRGKYFRQFLEALSINYSLDWKILNCADYGDATTRERFFLIAKRGKGKKIVFPVQTHASRKVIEKAKSQPQLFGECKSKLQPWVAAREIIDWSLEGKSIFGRKKPLSENTMRRIFAGLFKYSLKPFVTTTGGPNGQSVPRSVDEPMRTILTGDHQAIVKPYLINMKGAERRMRSIDEPTFTQTTSPNQQYLVEPFIANLSHTKNNDEGMCKEVDNPLPVICGKAMLGLIEPFLVQFFGEKEGQKPRTKDVDSPLWTITAQGRMALAEPFLVSFHSGQKDGGINRSYPLDEPLKTLDTSNRFAVAEPFIIPTNHGKNDTRSHSVDDPMKTITGVDAWGMIEPFLVEYYGQSKAAGVENPLPTVTAKDRFALVEPFLVRFKNNQDGQSIDDPLKTLTAKESYGLCIPQLGAILDIRFRMLQPHELSAAMSFPKDYHFTGTRDQKVRQIGNAVPVNTAKALCKAVLEN